MTRVERAISGVIGRCSGPKAAVVLIAAVVGGVAGLPGLPGRPWQPARFELLGAGWGIVFAACLGLLELLEARRRRASPGAGLLRDAGFASACATGIFALFLAVLFAQVCALSPHGPS